MTSDAAPHRNITVHFDGSCLGNPGPGGYAAILINTETGVRKNLSGHLPDTTNNRAELMSAIKALEFIRSGATITMVGDSQYVVKGMNEWLPNWRTNGWRAAGNKPVSNQDLWRQLDDLSRKPERLVWTWTRGHAGHQLNEEADQLARRAAEGGRG